MVWGSIDTTQSWTVELDISAMTAMLRLQAALFSLQEIM